MEGRSFLSGEHDGLFQMRDQFRYRLYGYTVITTIIRAPQPLQTCFGGEQARMCLERMQCSYWQLKVFARYKDIFTPRM